ncbi:FecR protein [Mucilaginibacter gossypiicola]|uniref:FecR protein n=1 Tax=Mucilaginibacter gossypiicola TaxID=551995 RepID=A0A1H8NWY3_9SPHI|nr:FecR family protein [Mucilaginibacter gossypiicola]SEO34155.1 FecR protein [Mucilaginibacter gossypiicola]
MISKEEFLVLYQKYLDGECSPAEKELLAAYSDDMHLPDDVWTEDDTDPLEVRTRIWQKLSESRQETIVLMPKRANYRWLWAAAALAGIAVLAGLLFIPHAKVNNMAGVVSSKTETKILPGGNKAYLTLANGSKIVLDDAKNGQLAARAGVKVSKTSNGLVVYKFDRKPTEQGQAAIPQINTITTPRGGQYQVVLEDGTKVQLNAASSIKFPEYFTGANREIELDGEAYFEVAKDKAHPFIVKANGTQVQVFGTHFNINAYSDNPDITTTLLEGSVKMSKGTAAVMLLPGQQGTVNQNGSSIKVQKADVEANMAWINGFFIFHDQSIINIMKQVSRWYDVDIEYQDAQVQENEFGGTISKYKDIKELLDNIKLTGSIHYKIEGRRVIIMK